ncbi:MAG: hypothetical protein JWM09_1500 [Francisellaceae bacterium]|nr:hypothetical protein [Francisellaceae bacterium]
MTIVDNQVKTIQQKLIDKRVDIINKCANLENNRNWIPNIYSKDEARIKATIAEKIYRNVSANLNDDKKGFKIANKKTQEPLILVSQNKIQLVTKKRTPAIWAMYIEELKALSDDSVKEIGQNTKYFKSAFTNALITILANQKISASKSFLNTLNKQDYSGLKKLYEFAISASPNELKDFITSHASKSKSEILDSLEKNEFNQIKDFQHNNTSSPEKVEERLKKAEETSGNNNESKITLKLKENDSNTNSPPRFN